MKELYLLPSSIGETDPFSLLPGSYTDIVNGISFFFVEEVRTARRFLRKVGFRKNFDDCVFVILNEHNSKKTIEQILTENNLSLDMLPSKMGLLSEAGLPCIADPGSELVAWAHSKNIKVLPICGPSSIFMSLMASGLNGQNFAFNGYLPAEQANREKEIRHLENLSLQKVQTQIFIETPYRAKNLAESFLKVCKAQTRLCIAKNIGMKTQFIATKSIFEWKKSSLPSFLKENTVFLLLA